MSKCGERWNLYDCGKLSAYTYALSDFPFPYLFLYLVCVDSVLFLLFVFCSVYLFVFCHSGFVWFFSVFCCSVLFCLFFYCSVLSCFWSVLLLSGLFCFVSCFDLSCFSFCFCSKTPLPNIPSHCPKLIPDMLFDT